MKAGFLAVILLLSGCGMFSDEQVKSIATPLLAEVAKHAAPYLMKMADDNGVEIDEEGTMCFPINEIVEDTSDVNLPAVALMCVAPKVQ